MVALTQICVCGEAGGAGIAISGGMVERMDLRKCLSYYNRRWKFSRISGRTPSVHITPKSTRGWCHYYEVQIVFFV